MAPMRGNKKNKEIVNEAEPQTQDGVEFANEEPQASKDSKIKALMKERDALTEALKKQQLCNRVGETDLDDGFENHFAKRDHRWQEWENHQIWFTTHDRTVMPSIYHARTSIHTKPSSISSEIPPRR